MSGSAAMCSSSVTSTARASIHAVCTPCRCECRRHDLAAGQLAHRDDRVVRRRRHLAMPRQGSNRFHQRGEVCRQPRDQRRTGDRASHERLRDAGMPFEQVVEELRGFFPGALRGETRRFDQTIGDLRHRRDDDHRRRRRRAPGQMVAHDRDHAVHRLRIGDRGAAELHDDVHSRPSRCISSAFRIAAPAAPRMVLWPSATNL